MNYAAFQLELGVVALAILILLLDAFRKTPLSVSKGYAAGVVGLGVLLLLSFFRVEPSVEPGAVVQLDAMAIGFKRMFLALGLGFFILAQNHFDRTKNGRDFLAYQVLMLFALVGMMLAASVNNLLMLFLTMEMVAVPFYVLTAYQRSRGMALEAGAKYLIMAGLSAAFMVMGIAFIYGTSGTLALDELAKFKPVQDQLGMWVVGIIFVVCSLGFKISAFPFQYWAPDVYQGSPATTTGLLASASKAVGFVLLVRFAAAVMPLGTRDCTFFWCLLSGASIIYGNLCAISQRDIKRLIAYSGVANAGYMMMAFAVGDSMAFSSMFYYLIAYTFTILGAFLAISVVETELERSDAEGVNGLDMDVLASLPRRSPFAGFLLAASMASLAGIPPMAGFVGKFLLLKSVFIQGLQDRTALLVLAFIALFGVIVSIYYYFGVIRAIYWAPPHTERQAMGERIPNRSVLWIVGCIALVMMVLPGVYPGVFLNGTDWMADALQAFLK